MSTLRHEIIKLAHDHPELRRHLLPLVKQAGLGVGVGAASSLTALTHSWLRSIVQEVWRQWKDSSLLLDAYSDSSYTGILGKDKYETHIDMRVNFRTGDFEVFALDDGVLEPVYQGNLIQLAPRAPTVIAKTIVSTLK